MDKADLLTLVLAVPAVLLALGELLLRPHPNHRFIFDPLERLQEDTHGDTRTDV